MTLDLSRVPHLEARKRLLELVNQRNEIEDAHEALLEPKVAAIDAEYEALTAQIGDDLATGFNEVVRYCAITELPLLRQDDIVRADGAVFLAAILPAEVAAKLAGPEVEDEDEFDADEEEAA